MYESPQAFCQKPLGILSKANLCFEKKEYDTALFYYQRCLSEDEIPKSFKDLKQQGNNHRQGETRIQMQIANIYTLKEEYSSAESWYRNALNLVDHGSTIEAEIYHNLGSLYFLKEDYEFATLYFHKAWIIYLKKPKENSGRLVDLLSSLGTVYAEKEEYRRSLSCFHKADSLLSISNKSDPARKAGMVINTGGIYLKLNEPAKALSQFRLATNLISGTGISSTNLLITSNEGMAESYSLLEKMDSAIDCMDICLKLITSNGINIKQDCSRVYLVMGKVLARQKEWIKSLEFCNKALLLLVPVQINPDSITNNPKSYEANLPDLYKIFEQKGICEQQIAFCSGYDSILLANSYHDFIRSKKICDYICKDFGRENSQIYHELTKPILLGIVESGFFLKKKRGLANYDDLFCIVDQSKNNILLEDLQKNQIPNSESPDSIRDKARALQDAIAYYSRKYIDDDWLFARGYTRLNEIQDKVINSKIKLDSIRKIISPCKIQDATNSRPKKNVDPSDIMKSVKRQEGILEYFCSDSVIYLFLIRKDSLFMKRVVPDASFHNLLKECLHKLKGAEIQHLTLVTDSLYDYLIAPIKSHLTGIKRLIIIPDEELSLFPFETLTWKDHKPEGYKNASSINFLIRNFEIIYHFSAAAWLKDTLNLNLKSTAYGFAGFAPCFRKTSIGQPPFTALPYAEKEVVGIGNLFKSVTNHWMVFLDTSATEQNFRLYTPFSTHIHIATHSQISRENPMNSTLVLSGNTFAISKQDKNDGLLHFDEICNLHLNASMVVLSSCSSGEGKVTRTEGVLSLTRGFYLAGASNVLYSLWQIPDQLTSEFMLDFYRYYFSGKSYSEALREVKLKMISNPATSLPYLWAGFVLLGE